MTIKKSLTLIVFFIACGLSAVLGGALSRNLVSSPLEITYADLIAVMLTGVTTLLAIVGVGIAILAFLGWTAIENTVKTKAEDFLVDRFKKGGEIYDKLEEVAPAIFLNYLKSGMDENDPVFREIRNILEQERYKDVPSVDEKPAKAARRRNETAAVAATKEAQT